MRRRMTLQLENFNTPLPHGLLQQFYFDRNGFTMNCLTVVENLNHFLE